MFRTWTAGPLRFSVRRRIIRSGRTLPVTSPVPGGGGHEAVPGRFVDLRAAAVARRAGRLLRRLIRRGAPDPAERDAPFPTAACASFRVPSGNASVMAAGAGRLRSPFFGEGRVPERSGEPGRKRLVRPFPRLHPDGFCRGGAQRRHGFVMNDNEILFLYS